MLSFRAISALVVLLAIAGAQADQVVLGKVDETIQPTYIYSSPNHRSSRYCRVDAYTYLIARQGPKGYVKVLLRNGSMGYTPESAVVWINKYAVTNAHAQRDSDMTSRSGDMIANYGLQFVGSPYKMGGTNVNTGIDCSAFVQKLYGDIAGKTLPRTAAEQALVGTPITRYEDLRPGDRLYFWDKSRGKIGHAGVYIGGGRFVHSSHGHGGVATDYLTESWQRILVSARRGGKGDE